MKILLLIILLSGCASNAPVIYQPAQIEVVYSDKKMTNNGNPVAGFAVWGKNICVVVLPRNDLRCVAHEIMHCFKGAFHGEKPSRRYCYN